MTTSPATHGLIINRITARPEAVFGIIRAFAWLETNGGVKSVDELHRLVAPAMSDDQFTDNLRVAQQLEWVSKEEDGQPRLLRRPDSEAAFKAEVMRWFRRCEFEDDENGLIYKAYRLALLMTPGRDGIERTVLVNQVNSSNVTATTSHATNLRAFNAEKANAWLNWLRYLDLAVGLNVRFVPTLLGLMRGTILAMTEKFGSSHDLRIRDLLIEVEDQAPCLWEDARQARPGDLPLATSAALNLLEDERAIRLQVVGDAIETWTCLGPGIRQPVTHVRLGG
jgi:hypothetical protein